MHSYSADLLALRQRAGTSSTYNFVEVQQHVAAAPDRVFCVVGGPGEGKSTLAAMMLDSGRDATGFIHASHFCKRADMKRQVMFGALAHPLACVQCGYELDIGLVDSLGHHWYMSVPRLSNCPALRSLKRIHVWTN